MRTFTMILSAILITLISVKVSAKETAQTKSSMETCKIVTGYGTAIGKGKTHSQAREEARLICGTKLIDQYFAQRREIAEDAKDDLALACVNLECQ
ncbi:MAG: hypothetical protein ACXVA9_04510 [Bdellovibrionales bacterium]